VRARPKLSRDDHLVMLVGSSIVSAAEAKRVLLLHSFGADVKPWSDYARSIRAELKLQSRWPLELYEHSLVTARSSDET
jgi:hypothetical protein